MRLGASLCIVALFLLSAQVVRADGISSSDPQILVGRGLDPAPPTPVGLQFDVELDASGGGIFNFTNDSGQDWVAFTLSATFATDMAMSFAEVCEVGSDIFLDISCAATGKTLNITFANGSIPAGSNFFLDFNQNSSFGSPGSENGAGIWGSGTDFEATAITTPEPGTLILFLSSLGGFWLRRKEMRA